LISNLYLSFLKAQHVDIGIFQEIQNQIDPQPHRIDVPGCQFHVGFLAPDSGGKIQDGRQATALAVRR
jgi:hypothetical protein